MQQRSLWANIFDRAWHAAVKLERHFSWTRNFHFENSCLSSQTIHASFAIASQTQVSTPFVTHELVHQVSVCPWSNGCTTTRNQIIVIEMKCYIFVFVVLILSFQLQLQYIHLDWLNSQPKRFQWPDLLWVTVEQFPFNLRAVNWGLWERETSEQIKGNQTFNNLFSSVHGMLISIVFFRTLSFPLPQPLHKLNFEQQFPTHLHPQMQMII